MSEKVKLINKLVQDAAAELDAMDTSDDEIDEVLDDLDEDLTTVLSRRCAVSKSKLNKSTNWYTEILPSLNDKRYKEMMRVTRSQFKLILNLIENHDEFKGKNAAHQLPVETQLAIVLYRIGSSGTGASIGKIAALFGVSDGGTIPIITQRVFNAILAREKEFVYWPNEDERSAIAGRTYHELAHCIGYLDGTEFPLSEAPSLDPVSYFSRKQVYSIKAQAVCDDNLKIRHIVVGYPGSVHDARIFANSGFDVNPRKYFSESQWLAADSAYRLTENVITPFRKNSRFATRREREKFNKYFSGFRVRIENCFGILKQKFPSLRQMRTRIKDKESHEFACRWVTVCAILHNIILPTLEDEDFQISDNENENDDEEDEPCPGHSDEKAGELKRVALFNIILNK